MMKNIIIIIIITLWCRQFFFIKRDMYYLGHTNTCTISNSKVTSKMNGEYEYLIHHTSSIVSRNRFSLVIASQIKRYANGTLSNAP